jgi:hypothetical protein
MTMSDVVYMTRKYPYDTMSVCFSLLEGRWYWEADGFHGFERDDESPGFDTFESAKKDAGKQLNAYQSGDQGRWKPLEAAA